MMDVVEKVAQGYASLTPDERKQVWDRLREIDPFRDSETGTEVEPRSPTAGASRRGSRPPFWLKTITGFDATKKKGAYRLQGDWVRPSKVKDVGAGALLCLGGKDADGDRFYALVKVQPGGGWHYEGPAGTVTVQDVALEAGKFSEWDNFEKAAKARV